MASQDGGIEASLRVLYTINNSPQYILAKSLDKHRVNVVKYGAVNGSNNLPSYGRVALKPCVTAICRSSPEVQPSGMRDYSLYVLDPLEDIMSRNARGSSDGVAVGMGLLSSILSSQESDAAMVTGTFIQCAADEVALEVVISLRQIATQAIEHHPYHAPQHYYGSGEIPFNPHEAYMRSMGMYDPNNPINHMMYPPYAPVAPAKQVAKAKATAILDNTRAAKFPTPYIGPPKRAPGRPSRKKTEGNVTPAPEQTPTLTNPQTSDLSSDTPTSQPDRASSCDVAGSGEDVSMSEAGSSESTPAVNPQEGSTSRQPQSMDEWINVIKKMASNSPEGISESELQNNPMFKGLLSLLQNATKNDQSTPTVIAAAIASADTTKAQQPEESQTVEVVEVPKETVVQVEQSVGNKENIKPQQSSTTSTIPHASEEKRRLSGVSSLSGSRRPSGGFLTSSSSPRRVSSSSSSSRSSVKRIHTHSSRDTTADAVENLRNIKKRRLEQQSGSANKASNGTSTPATKVNPAVSAATPNLLPGILSAPLQSNHGLHVNSGWGGLRMRADGSFSGGHPLRPAATIVQASASSSSKVVSFFRSATCNPGPSASNSNSAPVRKGPYKIPQWAKGVPPPSPPAWAKEKREKEVKEGGKDARKKKRGTGKKEGRIEVNKQVNIQDMVTSSDPAQIEEVNDVEQISSTPTPTKKAPSAPFIAHSDAPPIIAHSSPIARPRRDNAAPIFATSPCRPSTFASREPPEPETPGPTRRGSLFGTPLSCKSLRNGNDSMSSLFTPSPSIKTPSAVGSFAANVQVRLAGPSSPCPTGRGKRITVSSSAEFGRPIPLTLSMGAKKNMGEDEDLEMYHDDSEGPASSLPIASSDDDSMLDNEDVTMKLSFGTAKKDWASLGLPPSSPLPASSPLLSSADELPDVEEPSGSQSQNDADVSEEDGDGDGTCSDAGSTSQAQTQTNTESLLGLFDMTPSEEISATVLAVEASKAGEIDELDLQLQQELWSSSSDINVDLSDLSQFDWDAALMQGNVVDGLLGDKVGNIGVAMLDNSSATVSFGALDDPLGSFLNPLGFDDIFSTGM